MRQSLNHRFPAAKRPLIATHDVDGHPIVLVGLTRCQTAKVDRSAFERLMDMGVSPNWLLGTAGEGRFYVRTPVPGHLGFGNVAMVSRLITPPGNKGIIVRYRDGDRLNLRQDNLVMERGTTNAVLWECVAHMTHHLQVLERERLAA